MARRKHVLLPPWSDYFVAAVACLKARGGSATIEELEQDVAEKLHLSEKARAIPHGDGRRTQFQYDLAWVRTYLKWGKAFENSERGVWHITPIGREMSEAELRGLWSKIVAEHRLKRKLGRQTEHVGEEEGSNEEQQFSEVNWKERLLDILLTLDFKAFERLCQRLLRES